MKLNIAKFSCSGLATALILVAGVSAQATTTNLLTDGNFSAGLDGWSTAITYSGGFPNLEVISAYPGFALFNTGESPAGATLSQTFSTTPGQVYDVAFTYGVTGYTGGQQALDYSIVDSSSALLLSGVAESPVNGITLGNDSNGFNTFSFDFTAVGDLTTLTFADDPSNVTTSLDGLMTGASVTPAEVPEPTTNALMIAGLLGVVGMKMCRRGSAPSAA